MSPREALQERIVEWLQARARTFTAPYGILPGLHTRGRAKVRTITFGKSTEGNRSTPRRMNDAPPMTTSTMTSIVAKTGRRMQMEARARTLTPLW